jgi:hypothetical protein
MPTGWLLPNPWIVMILGQCVLFISMTGAAVFKVNSTARYKIIILIIMDNGQISHHASCTLIVSWILIE